MNPEVPTAQADPQAPPVVGPWALSFAVLGGLGAWIVRLTAGAALVGYACHRGALGHLALYALSLAAVSHALFSWWLCQRIRRRADHFPADTAWQAAGFAARVGALLNAIAVALILAESSLIPFVEPCGSL